MSSQGSNIVYVIRWVGRYLRPYWRMSTLLCLGLIFNQAFESFVPYSFKFILDDAIIPGNLRLLSLMLAGLGIGVLVLSLFSIVQDYLYARLGNSVLNDLRLGLFAKLQRLGLGYYVRTPKGEILSRFTTDIDAIENVIIASIPQSIIAIFGLLFNCIMLFDLEWRMATMALIGIALNILSVRLLEGKATEASFAMKEKRSRLTTILEENLSAQAVIKGFNLHKLAIAGFREELRASYKLSMRSNLIAYIMERLPNVGMLIVTILIIAMGAYLAVLGEITVGTFVSFYTLLAGASASVYSLTMFIPFLINSATSARRIDEILYEESQLDETPEARQLAALSDAITFQDVSFSYSGERRNLDEFSMKIRKGASVAFVGPSGSGKSTVLNLAVRFYDPAVGSVCFDGTDIRQASQESLRSQMGIVFQESFLFNVSVRDNIRMGKLDATDEEIIAAAKQAEAHEFIMKLPRGYDEMVGERGGRLSGGQRQRIAIARAIVKDPSILVLDEFTSALDPGTEASISATLQKIRGTKTILSVTHRLAPIKNCDCIFVLENGRLAESGKHEDLLAAGGLYTGLWEKQNGFNISEEGVASISVERLRQFPILSNLDGAQLERVSAFFKSEQFPEGRRIVSEGEKGDTFYIIVRGKVSVVRSNEAGVESSISVLTDGDHFGEIALLRNVVRTASVDALTPCTVLSLQREPFVSLVNESPSLREAFNVELKKRMGEVAAI